MRRRFLSGILLIAVLFSFGVRSPLAAVSSATRATLAAFSSPDLQMQTPEQEALALLYDHDFYDALAPNQVLAILNIAGRDKSQAFNEALLGYLLVHRLYLFSISGSTIRARSNEEIALLISIVSFLGALPGTGAMRYLADAVGLPLENPVPQVTDCCWETLEKMMGKQIKHLRQVLDARKNAKDRLRSLRKIISWNDPCFDPFLINMIMQRNIMAGLLRELLLNTTLVKNPRMIIALMSRLEMACEGSTSFTEFDRLVMEKIGEAQKRLSKNPFSEKTVFLPTGRVEYTANRFLIFYKNILDANIRTQKFAILRKKAAIGLSLTNKSELNNYLFDKDWSVQRISKIAQRALADSTEVRIGAGTQESKNASREGSGIAQEREPRDSKNIQHAITTHLITNWENLSDNFLNPENTEYSREFNIRLGFAWCDEMKMTDEYVTGLIKIYHHFELSHDEEAKKLKKYIIGELLEVESADLRLKEFLRDVVSQEGNPEIKIMIIRYFKKMGETLPADKACDEIFEMLASSEMDASSALAAVNFLLEFAEPTRVTEDQAQKLAITFGNFVVQDSSRTLVVVRIIELMAKIKRESFLEELKGALSNRNGHIAQSAAKAVGEIGGENATKLLETSLGEDFPSDISPEQYLSQTLMLVYTRAAGEEAMGIICEHFYGSNIYLKAAAVDALGILASQYHSSAALGIIESAYKRYAEASVQPDMSEEGIVERKYLAAIAKIKKEEFLPTLIKVIMSSEDPNLLNTAGNLINELAGTVDQEIVRKLLNASGYYARLEGEKMARRLSGKEQGGQEGFFETESSGPNVWDKALLLAA